MCIENAVCLEYLIDIEINISAAGIIAHESAMHDGMPIEVQKDLFRWENKTAICRGKSGHQKWLLFLLQIQSQQYAQKNWIIYVKSIQKHKKQQKIFDNNKCNMYTEYMRGRYRIE